MNSIEVCLDADNLTVLAQNARSCARAGVDRIELCANMQQDGLTPSAEAIDVTRKHFPNGVLMVMIRPRSGDFHYTKDELITMNQQIIQAKELGADGIVFGVLSPQKKINFHACQMLCDTAKNLSLKMTFHRAFDEITEHETALTQLESLAFDHVLTSGIAWHTTGSALDGINNIQRFINFVDGRLEIIIGGGVSPNNIHHIIHQLSANKARISFHSYSGVLTQGIVDELALAQLKN